MEIIRKNKKIIIIVASVVIVIAALVFVWSEFIGPAQNRNGHYKEAIALESAGNYEGAYYEIIRIGYYYLNENEKYNTAYLRIKDEYMLSSIVCISGCDTGAVFNTTFSAYNKAFNELYKEIYDEDDISQYWDFSTPSQNGTEENSGMEFTEHTIYLDKIGILISLEIIDGKVERTECTIDYSYEDTYNDLWQVYNYWTLAACTGISIEELDDIENSILNGIVSSGIDTVVVKDNALYSLSSYDSSYGYAVLAVSDEFVDRLEASGSLNVIRK